MERRSRGFKEKTRHFPASWKSRPLRTPSPGCASPEHSVVVYSTCRVSEGHLSCVAAEKGYDHRARALGWSPLERTSRLPPKMNYKDNTKGKKRDHKGDRERRSVTNCPGLPRLRACSGWRNSGAKIWTVPGKQGRLVTQASSLLLLPSSQFTFRRYIIPCPFQTHSILGKVHVLSAVL